MQKGGGLLGVLGPILGLGAAALAPEIAPALFGAEAGGEAAAESVPFLIPGTDTALEAAAGAPTFALDIPGAAAGGVGAAAAPELGAAAGAAADAAGAAAVPELGAAPGNLLAAEAPGAVAPISPLAATAPGVTGPLDAVAPTAIPASPISAAAPAPPGLSLTPDLTAAGGGLSGPQAGETINMFTTNAGAGDLGTAGGAAPAGAVATPYADLAPADQVAADVAADPTGTGAALGSPMTEAQALALPGENFSSADQATGLLAGAGDYAGKAGDYLLEHPGLPLTAGIAGMQLLRGNPQYPAAQTISGYANPAGAAGGAFTGAGVAGLENTAAATAGESAALSAPLTTGILPPGLKQSVDASTQAQKAAVRSNYASLGLSGSTMEADKLAQVDSNAAAQTAGIAEGLLPAAQGFSGQSLNALSNVASTGANLTGMSLNAYNALLSAQMKSDQNYQTALYNFARALAGSGYVPPTPGA